MWKKILSVFKRVDTVQHQVDDLLHLLFTAKRQCNDNCQDSFHGLSPRQCERLGVKILKLQDGVLSPNSRRRFYKTLLSDNASALYYFDFMELTRMLYALYQPQSAMQYCCSSDPLAEEL